VRRCRYRWRYPDLVYRWLTKSGPHIGANDICTTTGNDWDACRVKVTLRFAHSISASMQKIIPMGNGHIAETKSAIKRGIEADSFAWLKDDCKDLVLLLTKR